MKDGEHLQPALPAGGTLEAVRSLLRSRAIEQGLLPAEHDGATLDAAIETLLERDVATPEPTEEECARFYATHLQQFNSGDLAYARHILFAVTPGAPLQAIRAKAEETLLDLQRDCSRFGALARERSNCPSGSNAGDLGQLTRDAVVPEFAAAVFASNRTGLLPSLVRTRYGFHIVLIERRVAGQSVPFEAVHERIADELRYSVQERALRQYVQLLAHSAGVDIPGLERATSPLVQ